MGEKERLAISSLVIAAALFVPGFLLHAAPRFPGSLAGGLLGIVAALLFVLLLVYSLVKRIPWLKRRVALRATLSFHVYAGAIGAVFGILHTGHTYRSSLGILLVTAMLTVVLSGVVGRYYVVRIGTDVRAQRQELGTLRASYDSAVFNRATPWLSGVPVSTLVAGIADLENAIGRREALKRTLSRWVVLHTIGALVLYPLLALHIWGGIYYGLRWLP